MMTDHWFVSVVMPRKRLISSRSSRTRQTTTFLTEAEAKQFAKEMLAAGRNIMAGTLLSAQQPTRRIISGWKLRRWIQKRLGRSRASKSAYLLLPDPKTNSISWRAIHRKNHSHPNVATAMAAM